MLFRKPRTPGLLVFGNLNARHAIYSSQMKPQRFPSTDKGRRFELLALGIRDFAGLRSPQDRLDPFVLARYAGLEVVDFDKLRANLNREIVEVLIGDRQENWSGGAVARPLPDGRKLIILNPTHASSRQAATLMEEVSHVFLGHRPNRLARRSEDGSVVARDFDESIEEEAYGVGAAALVPFQGLVAFIDEGLTAGRIAKHFGVSRALIEFRIRVCRLSESYALFNSNWR
jgi:hypothetical protein